MIFRLEGFDPSFRITNFGHFIVDANSWLSSFGELADPPGFAWGHLALRGKNRTQSKTLCRAKLHDMLFKYSDNFLINNI